MDYTVIAKELGNLIDGDVSYAPEDLKRVARDTSLFFVMPSLVVCPKNTSDIEKVTRYVAAKKQEGVDISLTPRAAGTCMTGGPLTTSIVLDTSVHMKAITHADEHRATAESGVFYRDFEKVTLGYGWLMPSYPASRELAAIGGIVGNNSGGEKTLTYGKTERYVEALNVVFADGSSDVLKKLNHVELQNKMAEKTESGRIHREMYALISTHYDAITQAKPTVSKNSSGYYLWNVYDKEHETFDLTKLIVGSQGTLATITSATLTGVSPHTHARMLIMFLPTTEKLGDIISKLLKHKPETLESYDDHTFGVALKFFGDIARRMGGNFFTLGLKFLPEFWMALTGGIPKLIIMAEFVGDTEEDVEAQVIRAYDDMMSYGVSIKRTKSKDEAKKYWTFRRESFNLLRQKMKEYRTAPTIDDICVHPEDLPSFLPELEAIFAKYPNLIYTIAGHMGDANFHVIPLVDIHEKGIVETLHALMDEVYDLTLKYHGSISAEHNDGLLRTAYLPKMFSPEIITLFEKTKDIFDPQHILNPGKKVYGDKNFAWSHIDTE